MKLRIFTDDGMFLPCHIFKNSPLKDYYENEGEHWRKQHRKVGRTAQIKKVIRQMVKIEKLSQKWVYGRQDEDYLYYEDKNTKYKFNKVYWRE